MSKKKALGCMAIGTGLGLLLWQGGEFIIWPCVQYMANQGV